MEVTIRSAELKDVAEILNIVNDEIKNTTTLYDYNERTYDFQLNWFNQKLKDSMPVIVAERDNKILGFGTYGSYRPFDAFQFTVEHSIYVGKKHRSVNVGKLIMTQLICHAKDQELHTMVAGIDASNDKSINFHKQFGFTEVGTFKEVGYKFNKWLDLIFMQLMLNQ